MDTLFPPLPEWFWYPVVFLYGAIVGSFLNVLIYRLPLISFGVEKHLTIGGKSFCPRCHNYLKPYHNVPLLGFLFLKGRCAFCRVRISWRYPMVELVTACLWTVLYHQIGTQTGVTWVDFVFQALFASVLIAMVFIDLDHFIAPDELNVVGFIFGLGRDLVCLGLAYYAGRWVWEEFAPRYTYFGWLPRAIPGALTYGGVMLLVSYLGFVYYARNEGESLAQVSRRFLSDEEEQPEAGMATIPLPQTAPEALVEGEQSEAVEEEGDPPRLQFSPGFIAFMSALFLYVPAGWWCLAALFVPLLAFLAFARFPGEPIAQTARRFFKADDQAGVPDDADPLDDQPVSKPEPESQPTLTEADLQAEADRFAREAQTGSAGGMGLGDVKLGLAIGALLGPGMALLSLLFATGIGAVTGGILAGVNRQNNLRIGVPFVPFMAAGAILVMLFGNSFVGWYLRVSGLAEKPKESTQMASPFRPDRPTRDNPFARPPLVPGPTQGQGTGNRE